VPVGVGGAIAVPLRLVVCGLPLASSIIVTAALRDPAAVGENVTLIEQLADATMGLLQSLVWAKSPEFVPVILEPILSPALPMFVSMTDWDGLVVPTICALKARALGISLTAGAGAGGGVTLAPPPHATHTPAIKNTLAARKIAGRHRFAEVPTRNANSSTPANSPGNSTGRWKLGGDFGCTTGGATAEPVVVMVSVLVTGDALVTLTDAGKTVQVAPVGHPASTLRLTVPVNPLSGATLIAELPPCPGAEILIVAGFADTLKSVTVIVTGADAEPA
jgi:hypothetical protein